MRSAIYLLPDAALFAVLARMVGVRLHAERPAMFAFLSAWLLRSLILLLAAQLLDPASESYRRAHWLSEIAVWAVLAVALVPALVEIGNSYWVFAMLAAALLLSAAITGMIFNQLGTSWAISRQALSCWVWLMAGAAFAVASVKAAPPDATLWRGAGIFLLIYGGGILLAGIFHANASGAGYALIALGGAMVWAGLAWFLGPHADVLVNLEKLGWIWPVQMTSRAYAAARTPGVSSALSRSIGERILAQLRRRAQW